MLGKPRRSDKQGLSRTASFWKPEILSLVDQKPEDEQTEVILLPAAKFAEKDG